MTTPAAENELVTSRVIDAPRERVFAAFADGARLARWWGPKGFTNTFAEFEFRHGGAWNFVQHGPDGGNYPNQSTFGEVSAGRVVIRHLSAPRFQLEVSLLDEGGRTRLGWRQIFESAADCAKVRGFAVRANEENLDRLEAEMLRPA